MSRVLQIALLLFGVFMSGLLIGKRMEAGRQLQSNQAVATQGQAEFAQAVDAGASAVAAVQTQAASALAVQTQIETELTHHVRRTPLTLAPQCRLVAGAVPGGADRAAVDAGNSADAAPSDASPLASAPPAVAPGRGVAGLGLGTSIDPSDGTADVPLTLGAVRLWNSALTGELRAAALAADTCPADDPAASACAVGAGLNLRDAWLNHTANAASCAQDRSQLEQLITLLRERQPGAARSPTESHHP